MVPDPGAPGKEGDASRPDGEDRPASGGRGAEPTDARKRDPGREIGELLSDAHELLLRLRSTHARLMAESGRAPGKDREAYRVLAFRAAAALGPVAAAARATLPELELLIADLKAARKSTGSRGDGS